MNFHEDVQDKWAEGIEIAGPQKRWIRQILRRIRDHNNDDERVHHSEALRDLWRKLVSHTWSHKELAVLDREVTDEIARQDLENDEEVY